MDTIPGNCGDLFFKQVVFGRKTLSFYRKKDDFSLVTSFTLSYNLFSYM